MNRILTPLLVFIFFACSEDAVVKNASTKEIVLSNQDTNERSNIKSGMSHVSETFDSLLISKICKSINESNGYCQDDLKINSLHKQDSILVLESTCSCGSPCTVNIISTFSKAGIPIDWMAVYESCDCPSECEGCGWSKINRVNERTFQITEVSEKVIPKYDENGTELDFECDVIRSYLHKTFVINNDGGFILVKSIEESDDTKPIDSLKSVISRMSDLNENDTSIEDTTPIISRYETAELSGKVWMIQNLNEATDGALCYNENSDRCSDWGLLYTFKAAKKACATLGEGWRLPNDTDWRALTRSYGGAYGDLNSDGKKGYSLLYKGGSSGFNATLGGKRINLGNVLAFYDAETIGYYWSDQGVKDEPNHAAMYTFRSSDNFLLHESIPKEDYISCRCARDL